MSVVVRCLLDSKPLEWSWSVGLAPQNLKRKTIVKDFAPFLQSDDADVHALYVLLGGRKVEVCDQERWPLS